MPTRLSVGSMAGTLSLKVVDAASLGKESSRAASADGGGGWGMAIAVVVSLQLACPAQPFMTGTRVTSADSDGGSGRPLAVAETIESRAAPCVSQLIDL